MPFRRASRFVSLPLPLCAGWGGGVRAAAPVKRRFAVLIDTSSEMFYTPQSVTFPETCATAAFNGCTGSGNPTAAQETCNACVVDTLTLGEVLSMIHKLADTLRA